LTLPRCPEARGNIFNLDLTLTRKFFELSGHAGATLTGRVCAPSNGFRAAVYDSIGPPLAFMIVNSGTRWLPEPETFGSKSGRGAAQGTNRLAISRNPSVGIQSCASP